MAGGKDDQDDGLDLARRPQADGQPAGQDPLPSGAERRRTHYQVGPECQARQIEVLLRYPKVGALGMEAIAINLGTDLPHVRPILTQLLNEGRLKQVEHDRYIWQNVGADVKRDGS